MCSIQPQKDARKASIDRYHLCQTCSTLGFEGSALKIPLIDIEGFDSPEIARRSSVVSQWCQALDSIGFVTIRGHGIADALTADIYQQARAFFERPLEQKLHYAAHNAEDRGAAGYIPPLAESVGRTAEGMSAPDIVESLSFSDVAGAAGSRGLAFGLCPELPSALRAAVEAYASAAYALGLRLMRLSAQALGLSADYFDHLYSPMQHKLRLACYPEQITKPLPGQLRNAAHTDFAGFTILLQDSAPGGLQVLMPDGEWIDVPSVPGTLVINTGDLLQRWTNDRWMSNTHRVVNPPIALPGSNRRLSIVFFTGPRADASIICLPVCASAGVPARYPPITAGEYVQAKIRQTYGAA
jgi:isopenicillin N synthase-like dioxygenase